MTIVLHPQGVLEVPQNATAAVVCRVQHDSGQKIFTVFTWDGGPLQVGHRHLNSGLLDVSFTRCVTDAGHICEEFTLTVKGVSAANGSIVGCCSTNFSAEFRADGHVQITVIDSISGEGAMHVCRWQSALCFQCGSVNKFSTTNMHALMVHDLSGQQVPVLRHLQHPP